MQQSPVQIKGRDVFGLLRVVPTSGAPTPPPPLGSMLAKVRMETPVLYFYAPQEMSVSVKVSFDKGVISEWYPRVAVPPPNFARPLATTVGGIEWPAVTILPVRTSSIRGTASRVTTMPPATSTRHLSRSARNMRSSCSIAVWPTSSRRSPRRSTSTAMSTRRSPPERLRGAVRESQRPCGVSGLRPAGTQW